MFLFVYNSKKTNRYGVALRRGNWEITGSTRIEIITWRPKSAKDPTSMLKQLLNRISGLTQLPHMTICTLNYAPRHFIKSLKARKLERYMKVLKILSSVLKYFLMRKSSQQTPFWNSELVARIISNFGNKSPMVLQYLTGNTWYKLGEKVGAEIPFFVMAMPTTQRATTCGSRVMFPDT